MKVLLVDDYDATARTFQKLFAGAGHDAIVANSAAQAIEAAKTFMPDVVITDIMMPEMDGYDLAKALKEEHAPQARIVGLSAYPSASQDSRSAYIDAHLQKPVAFRKLLATALGTEN